MKEESSQASMETDVSSTTSDIPSNKEANKSTREVVVVVEKLEDEETPYETSNTNNSNQPAPEVNDHVKRSLESLQKAIASPIDNQADIILIEDSPEKKTTESEEPVDSTNNSCETNVQGMKVLDKLTPQNFVQIQEPANRSPKKVELSQNSVSISPTKTISPIKIQLKEESPGNKDKQKSPNKTDQKTVQKSPVKLLELPKSGKTPTKDSVQDAKEITISKLPENENHIENKDKEGTNVSDSITESESIDENETGSLSGMVCDTLNDSLLESNSDTADKDHNKSISRELKSLIKSAKESKIINECTQLTSKMRKSRGLGNSSLDNSSVSPISPLETAKLNSRRGSTNSQRSTSSEVSEKITVKRSMRSQNPEFVNKVKQFLNSVTGKGQKDDEVMSEEEIDISRNKSKLKISVTESGLSLPKKKKTVEETPNSKKLLSDPYCWRCHWVLETEDPKAHEPAKCTVCPRTFHYKCLSVAERSKITNDTSWVCPDCLTILNAESSETRLSTMRNISLGKLCDLLSNVLERMMEMKGVEPFMQPVDLKAFPDYNKYVVHPMDLSLMKKNVTAGVYGSTEAFAADAQWILHNSIIFNTLQSKLTGVARALLRSCRTHLSEIEACPECYAAALANRPTWFTDVCSTPHILLWAKLKGFPFWPAKGMSVNSAGLVDVRFFGAHDRAWVHTKDCFLYCEKDPNNFRTKRQDLISSMEEAEQHIRSISRKYGSFVYPPYKTPFDSSKITEQLKMMIPSFKGETTMRSKESFPSSPSVRRKSKSRSKDYSYNECDTSDDYLGTNLSKNDNEETPKKDEPNKETDVSQKEDKPMDVDTVKVDKTNVVDSTQAIEESRKRRRSHLEEAVLTVLDSNTAKQKRKCPELDTNTSTVEVIALLDDVLADKDTNHDKVENKNTETGFTNADLQSSSKKGTETPKTNKQTPKVAKTSKKDKSTSKEKHVSKIAKLKDRNIRPKFKIRIKDKSQVDKKNGKRSNSKGKKSEIQGKIKTYPGQNNFENKTTNSDDKDINSDNSTPITSSVKSYSSNTNKTLKNRLTFDDDTSLAVIAREVAKNNIVNVPGLPTISDIRSLSAEGTSKASTQNRSYAEITIEGNSESIVFTPACTYTDNARTNDATNKLQALKSPPVGRVGVKAFARMSPSPVKQSRENVEVKIKTEPIDYDDDRQNDKLTLMNVFELRPVNPTNKGTLRDIRINKVVSGPPAKKTPVADIRPKARKTFPQQKKPDEVSGLSSKNSMVYIPIQPPITQAPVRTSKSHVVSSTSATSSLLTTSVGASSSSQPIIIPDTIVTSTANNVVNVIASPLLSSNTTSTMSILPTLPTVPSVGQVPTNVHTVPLITSVNGQWTFSLQPVMSVGGVDSPNSPPIVNGVCDRPASIVPQLANIAPHPASKASSNLQKTTDTITTTIDLTDPQQPQRVMPRALSHPLDPNSPAGPVPPPSSAGPATAKLNQNATKLADFFRYLLEESYVRVAEPEAQLASVKLQLERERWRHKQEIEELKHNNDLMMNEMLASFEKEKARIVAQMRHNAQTELENTVNIVKSKQWCVHCKGEAQFYCCWNTSYCDYRCQRAHWSTHHSQCAQKRTDSGSNGPAEREGNSSENGTNSQSENMPRRNLKVVKAGTSSRLVSEPPPPPQQKSSSFIVSMVEDQSGKQTVKCVGAYKAGTATPSSILVNKQMLNNDEAKKVVTSGGYLIVGTAGANSSVENPRRTQTIQYLQS